MVYEFSLITNLFLFLFFHLSDFLRQLLDLSFPFLSFLSSFSSFDKLIQSFIYVFCKVRPGTKAIDLYTYLLRLFSNISTR